VRVNAPSSPLCHGDLMATLAKERRRRGAAQGGERRRPASIDWLIWNLELERGIAPGSIDLMPQIETAAGVQRIPTQSAGAQPASVSGPGGEARRVGAADPGHDLGLAPTLDEPELADARNRVGARFTRRRLRNPIDSPWFHFEADAFRALWSAAAAAVRDAFACIRPARAGERACRVPRKWRAPSASSPRWASRGARE
jgi:hypothetical protein